MDISVRITRDENAEYFGVEIGDVVKVPFEQYVAGVVASEVGNSALEVCKAQAVASRTFAVSKGVLGGKTISDASSTDQAYRAGRIPSGLYPNAENGTKQTTGQIREVIGLATDITDRHVIIVEDIIDSGLTMAHMIETLQKHNPASISVCTLLLKPDSLRVQVPIDYCCMKIPNDFIVGYGLDYDGFGRNTRDIYTLI